MVVYHPDRKSLLKTFRSYADTVDTVLVWRNSPEPLDLPIAYSDKVVMCGNGENAYMAAALNHAVRWCADNGYRWLLTMDQDSEWEDCRGFIDKALSLKQDNVALYCPDVNHRTPSDCETLDIESTITSGSLCDVQVAVRLGGFREDYQIYWVDGEYCYWARKNGCRIVMLPRYNLLQQFGRETRTLFGFTTSNYSPRVYYFMFRNMLWMKREFHDNPSLRCVLYTSMYCIRGIVLGERQKLKKLAMIAKACFVGLFARIAKRRHVVEQ